MYNNVSNECTGTYRIIDNKKIIKQAVSNNLCTLKYAPDKLKDDVDVLYSALSSNNDTTDVLSNFWTRYVHNNEVLTEKLLKKNGLFLQYDNWGLETDKPTVLIAVKSNGVALQYASDALKSDREVVFAAVTQNGMALRYASEELQNDRAIVLAAVTQNGMALEYASEELQNDRAVVLAAVKKEGMALRYASDALKKDKNLVLKAVSNNGLALESSLVYQPFDDLQNYDETTSEMLRFSLIEAPFDYYDDEGWPFPLQKDNEIVKNAVEQNGLALKFAGRYFIDKKTNRDWIKDKIIQDGTMFVFLFDSNEEEDKNIEAIKDFVEKNFWSKIGTDNICKYEGVLNTLASFYSSKYKPSSCTKFEDLPKNIETIFGGTERAVSKNLIKLLEVSMEYFSDDYKNRKDVEEWYIKMGLYKKYEDLFRIAPALYVAKEGYSQFIYKESIHYKENYLEIVKEAAIKNINNIHDTGFYMIITTLLKDHPDVDSNDYLEDILKGAIKNNSIKVMEVLANSKFNIGYGRDIKRIDDKVLLPFFKYAMNINKELLKYIVRDSSATQTQMN